MKAVTTLKRICIAITFLSILTSETIAQTKWLRYFSPNNDFSINFPDDPKHETHTTPTGGPPLELYTVVFNKHLLNIGFKELKPVPRTKRQRASALSGAVRSQLDWIRNVGGQLLKQQLLSNGGVQFDYIGRLDDGTPTYNRDRIYVYGIRYYQLRCLSVSPTRLNESIASQFFNSFRFSSNKAPSSESNNNN
jgi:hypothetical protein